MKKILWSPTLLSGRLSTLREDLKTFEEKGVDYIHADVMDGHFVPNYALGTGFIRDLRGMCSLPLDIHLMIERPERYIESFAKAGAKVITVHAEATVHLNRLLHQIRECGCLAGVALNPATPPACLEYVLGDFDLALVMTVNPGFGGQKLIPAAARKIAVIRDMLAAAGAEAEIEVDGGVNARNAPELISLGATVLVTGSAFFHAPDAAAFVRQIRDAQ